MTRSFGRTDDETYGFFRVTRLSAKRLGVVDRYLPRNTKVTGPDGREGTVVDTYIQCSCQILGSPNVVYRIDAERLQPLTVLLSQLNSPCHSIIDTNSSFLSVANTSSTMGGWA